MGLNVELAINTSEVRTITGLKGYQIITHQRRKKKIIRLIMQHCNSGCSLLDVGCGCGDIALELVHHGYNVIGIDLEPVRIQKANALAENMEKANCFHVNDFKILNIRINSMLSCYVKF